MSEQRNRVKVQHIRSNQREDVAYESAILKFPKLPTAEQLSEGEIAVNYGAGVETLSLKNGAGEIVRFVNEKELNEVSEVSAAAITELNEKIELSQSKIVKFKIGVDELVTCDTPFNELRALLPSGNGNEVHCIIPLLNMSTGEQTFSNVTGDLVGFGPHNIDFAFSVPMSSTVSWGNNAIVAVREVVVRATDSAVTPAYIAKNEYNYESMVVNCENTGEDAYRIDSAFLKIREEYSFGHKIVLMYQSSEQTVSAYNIGSVYMDETESEVVGFRFVAPTDEGIDWFYIYKDENEVEHIEHGTDFTHPLVAVFHAPSLPGQDIRCNVTAAEIGTALNRYRPVVGLWLERTTRCNRTLLPSFNSDIWSEGFAFTSVGPNDILVVSFNNETSKWKSKVYPLFKEIDGEPTEESTNPVSSGGVYDRMERDSLVISAALNDLNDRLVDAETGIEEKQDTLTFDNAPTANSTNPVTSGGVYSAIADSEEVVEGVLLNDGFHSGHWVNDSFVPANEPINGEAGVLYLDVETHKLYHVNANDVALARFTYHEIGTSTVDSVIENSNLAVTSGGVYDKFAEYSLAISAALNELNDKVAALEEDNIVLKAEVERLKAANQNP